MMYVPCQRIVRADVPPSFRVRGISAPLLLCWPDAALGSGADYSVDFEPILCCTDRIVRVGASTVGGTIAWTSVFGTLATVWVQWTTPGPQTTVLTVITSGGASLTVSVSITVGTLTARLPAPVQPALSDGTGIPPNALLSPSGAVLCLDSSHIIELSISDLLTVSGQQLLSPSGKRLRNQVFETRTDILFI